MSDRVSDKRRICVVTGSRAEYGLLRPVIEAVAAHPALSVQLIVTGAHLSETFGLSVRAIERDKHPIAARVPAHPAEDSGRGVARAVADGVRGMAEALDTIRPDALILLGDRFEVLAAATAATYLGVPIGHIHGGDVTCGGGADESARHAITKMAHLHFAATATSAARIRRMGEEPWRIHVTGAPCLDTILRCPIASPAEVRERFDLPNDAPYLVLVQHSISTQSEAAGAQIQATLEALKATGLTVVALYPNVDAGSQSIISKLEGVRDEPWIRLHRSLPHPDFLNLLRHCGALVGNSSAGIIESPALRIPAVNIGPRQDGRERADNVIDVPNDAAAIAGAIARALSKEYRARLSNIVNPYGDGNAGKRIARCLASAQLGPKLLQKKFCDDR